MQSVKRLSSILYSITKTNQRVFPEAYYYSASCFFKNIPTTRIQTKYIITGNTFYSTKSKNKGSKDKKHNAKVAVKATQLSEVIDFAKLTEQLDTCVSDMKNEFIEHLTLRNAAGSLEQLKVKHNSKEYALQEIADIVRKNPKNVILNMDAFPHLIPSVTKAITQSGMNLNPQQDGTSLIIPIPKITTEYREGLAKKAKILYNKYNKKISTIEVDSIKIVKKNPNKLSDDFIYSVTQQLTTLSNKYHDEIKTLYSKKHVELVGK